MIGVLIGFAVGLFMGFVWVTWLMTISPAIQPWSKSGRRIRTK